MDAPTAAAGILAIVTGGIALTTMGSSRTINGDETIESLLVIEPDPEPEKVDLSIPYDAAARLAYDQWRTFHEMGDFDDDSYASFKSKYETMTVANVIAKKMERDILAMIVKPSVPVVLSGNI